MADQTRTIVRDRGWNRIERELKKLMKGATAVGFFSEDMAEGLFIASIAFWNEYGTKNIPSRPAIRNWLDSKRRKIAEFKKTLLNQIYDGFSNSNLALKRLGEYAQGGIKRSIIDLKLPPNAPATIAQKGSSNPLIDTGRMVGSVRHKEGLLVQFRKGVII